MRVPEHVWCTVERSIAAVLVLPVVIVFFFNDTATTEIYTLSLHDALPISSHGPPRRISSSAPYTAMAVWPEKNRSVAVPYVTRSEGTPGLRQIIPSGGANAQRPWQSWRSA